MGELPIRRMSGGRPSGIRGGGERGLNPPSDDLDPRFRGGLTALLAVIALFGAIDLVLDRPATLFSAHVLFELAFIALCLGGVAYVWRGWLGVRAELAGSQRALRDRELERDRWRDEANRLLAGLGAAIEAQFERWGLTPAEKEVALLLLKGLGHKEAAVVLARSERTVRQHAIAVYRKSGLAGRAELAAFFLEDLLLPQSGSRGESARA
ncbi:MAG: LuxR family transcriptional regulator [Deltaproteobacteria bacterium]|nr:LuxR family transcriptional regulator [Deltaproteobacteria bacterium]